MRIFVNGVRVDYRINLYMLGPFRLELPEFLEYSYNRIMVAHQTARMQFERQNGFPWEPAYPLILPKFSPREMQDFMTVGRAIEAASVFHDKMFGPAQRREESPHERMLILLLEDCRP